MPKLTLEKTFETSFRDIAYEDREGSLAAFNDYNRRIKLLGERGRLGINAFQDLIHPERDRSDQVAEIGTKALQEKSEQGDGLFELGFSAIVTTGDYIDAVYDNPNPDPVLNSYGPGLMWAALKIGQERFAKANARSSSTVAEGYRVVNEALTGKPTIKSVPFASRHHIGGNGIAYSAYPESSSMRILEEISSHAGVSGVLYRPAFLALALKYEGISGLVDEAHETDALDGFEGNLFAGSIDSTLAGRILLGLYQPQVAQPAFIDSAVSDILARRERGINIH